MYGCICSLFHFIACNCTFYDTICLINQFMLGFNYLLLTPSINKEADGDKWTEVNPGYLVEYCPAAK